MSNSTLTLAFAIASLCNAASAQSETPAFSITISTPHDAVKAGSDIRVDITETNISNHDIGVAVTKAPGDAEFLYDIHVRYGEGKPATGTKRWRWLHGLENTPMFSSSVGGTLKPGLSLKQFTTLKKLYDISQPGKYTIQVESHCDDSKSVVKSNIITVTVAK